MPSEPKRAGDGTDNGKPKGIGSIEEDSDNIILLHRCKCDDEEWDDLKRPMLIKIEKQRSGATGVIQAVMFPRKFKFYEVTR